MITVKHQAFSKNQNEETHSVENILRSAGFEQVDSYRYNSASIRVRVIDARFEGLSHVERDTLIEPYLAKLPDDTQADIVTLLALAPSELAPGSKMLRQQLLNLEFEDPSPSQL